MLDFLEGKRVENEERLLSEDEKERLKQENEELKENMAKVTSEMQETARLVSESKSDEQKQRLKVCLSKNFLFSTLNENDCMIVIGAMKEVKVEAKKRIINQGEDGDVLYVIEKGVLDCIIKADGTEKAA